MHPSVVHLDEHENQKEHAMWAGYEARFDQTRPSFSYQCFN
jgi:hypothetical protein